jgi:hypothetical protein
LVQTSPIEVPPHLPDAALPDADWADAFEIQTDRELADLKAVADCMVGAMPFWAGPLLWLRNILVAPFGLKPADPGAIPATADRAGFFPVLSQDSGRIVLGLDDRHLDFRIVLERRPCASGDGYRLTTLVERHNRFGRLYIFLISPFHKRIVRSVMKNAL